MEKNTKPYDPLRDIINKTRPVKPSDDFTGRVMNMVNAHAEARQSDEKLFNLWYWLTGAVVLAVTGGLLYYFDIAVIDFNRWSFNLQPDQILIFFSRIYKGFLSVSKLFQPGNLGLMILASLAILGGLELLLHKRFKLNTFLVI